MCTRANICESLFRCTYTYVCIHRNHIHLCSRQISSSMQGTKQFGVKVKNPHFAHTSPFYLKAAIGVLYIASVYFILHVNDQPAPPSSSSENPSMSPPKSGGDANVPPHPHTSSSSSSDNRYPNRSWIQVCTFFSFCHLVVLPSRYGTNTEEHVCVCASVFATGYNDSGRDYGRYSHGNTFVSSQCPVGYSGHRKQYRKYQRYQQCTFFCFQQPTTSVPPWQECRKSLVDTEY